MIRTVKEAIASAEKRADFRAEHRVRDEHNRVVIDVGIKSEDAFFSPYCTKAVPMIDGSLGEYIETKLKGAPKETEFAIHFHLAEGVAIEEEIAKRAVEHYLDDRVVSTAQRYRRNGFVSFFMGLIGVLLLVAMLLVERLTSGLTVLYEVMDIAAWVFLWEAVDQFFFARSLLKLDLMVNRLFADATVRFITESTV